MFAPPKRGPPAIRQLTNQGIRNHIRQTRDHQDQPDRCQIQPNDTGIMRCKPYCQRVTVYSHRHTQRAMCVDRRTRYWLNLRHISPSKKFPACTLYRAPNGGVASRTQRYFRTEIQFSPSPSGDARHPHRHPRAHNLSHHATSPPGHRWPL